MNVVSPVPFLPQVPQRASLILNSCDLSQSGSHAREANAEKSALGEIMSVLKVGELGPVGDYATGLQVLEGKEGGNH